MAKPELVGLIGVGLMGHGIGKNILAKGFALTVLAHRNRGPVEDLVAKGAKELKSPKEVTAASDLVITVVGNSNQLEDIVFREDGILAGVHKGTIMADCTTAMPDSTLKIAKAIQEGALAYLKRQFRTIGYILVPLAIIVFVTSVAVEKENGTEALSFVQSGTFRTLAFLAGCLGLFGDVARQSLLPGLVSRSRVPDANAKLAISESVARVGGPGLAGLLVQVLTAPIAIAAFQAGSVSGSAKALLVIGFAGWFDHWDRLDFMVDVFAEVHRAHPNTRLCLVGDGPGLQHVRDRIRSDVAGGAVPHPVLGPEPRSGRRRPPADGQRSAAQTAGRGRVRWWWRQTRRWPLRPRRLSRLGPSTTRTSLVNFPPAGGARRLLPALLTKGIHTWRTEDG